MDGRNGPMSRKHTRGPDNRIPVRTSIDGGKTEGVGWKWREGRCGGWTALQGGGGGGRRGGQARDAVLQGDEAGERHKGWIGSPSMSKWAAGRGWLGVDRGRKCQGRQVLVVVGWA